MRMAKGWILGLATASLLAGARAQEAAVPTTNTAGVHETAAAAPLPPGAAELVRLAQSGMAEDVLLAYAQGVSEPFNLSADNVVYLRDLGITSTILTAMLNRDKELHDRAAGQPVIPEYVPPANEVAMIPPPMTDYPLPDPNYVGNAPAEVSYFYNDLSPYGSWVVLPSYGWCWQPSVVVLNQGWRPYCDAGRWVYANVGWYWQSDYSWGWAPFHYGRWMQHPSCGWVWFPDTAWSPAWVTWRVGGDNCGWAPMPWRSNWDQRHGYQYNGVSVGAGFDFGLKPDCFTFVGLGDFCSSNLRKHCLAPTQVTQAFGSSAVVNNFNMQNSQTIVNGGVSADRIERATGIQLRPVAVTVDRGDFKNGRGGGPGTLPTALPRRELTAPARVTPIVAERLDDRQPVLRHPELARMNLERRNPAMEMPTGRRGSVGGNPPAVTGGTPGGPSAPQYSYPTTGNYRGNGRGQVTGTSTGARQGSVPGVSAKSTLETPKDRATRSSGVRSEQRGSVPAGTSYQQTQSSGGSAPQASRGQSVTPATGGGSSPAPAPGAGPRSGAVVRPADTSGPQGGDPSRGR